MKKSYKEIAINKLRAKNNQPRTYFNDEKIEELALSIKENGILQPISVRKMDGYYEIIAGERRFRACTLLGMKEVPCIILKQSDVQGDTLSLIENIQRENLTVIEEAKAYIAMIELHGFTQSELATRIGKKQATIANKIRLLKLNPTVIEAVETKKITERHARALLSVDFNNQKEYLNKIISNNLNVKQTEDLIVKKPKPKAIIKTTIMTKGMKLALNTIKHSVKMLIDSGVYIDQTEEETEEELIITIRVKK